MIQADLKQQSIRMTWPVNQAPLAETASLQQHGQGAARQILSFR
jgi:hypothetical protein